MQKFVLAGISVCSSPIFLNKRKRIFKGYIRKPLCDLKPRIRSPEYSNVPRLNVFYSRVKMAPETTHKMSCE